MGVMIESSTMNERQQSHIDYLIERSEYWHGLNRQEATSRMLAARDAVHVLPLRSAEEGSEVFYYLHGFEQEQPVEGGRPG